MTDEQMKERLESAEKLLNQIITVGVTKEKIEAHFDKYQPTAPLWKLWETHIEKWFMGTPEASEKAFNDFKSHFSDFLLTPEKEAEIWNQALDDLLKIIDVNMCSMEDDYTRGWVEGLTELEKDLNKLRKPTKGGIDGL